MKRFLTVAALTAIAAFTLAACGRKAEPASEDRKTIDTSTLPEQTTAPTPDPVLPAEPSPLPSGTTPPAPPPPTQPGDPSDTTPDTMGPAPKV